MKRSEEGEDKTRSEATSRRDDELEDRLTFPRGVEQEEGEAGESVDDRRDDAVAES